MPRGCLLALSVAFCLTAVLRAQAPPPREVHLDRNGYPLPPGAVARLGIPPALPGYSAILAWTPDGREYVAADEYGVTRFDAATGRWLRSYSSLATDKPAQRLLCRGLTLLNLEGAGGTLVDVGTGEDFGSFNLPSPLGDEGRRLASLSVSANGRFLAGIARQADGPSSAWRYDLARNRYSRLINDRADLHSLRLSPDGKVVFATAGTDEPELTARDVANDKPVWTARLKAVGTLRAVSADGRRLAVLDRTGVTIFDAANGRDLHSASPDTPSSASSWGIDLSPDGSRLAWADSRQVTVWDVATGKVLHRLPHEARLVSFSPDGKSLLTASAWIQKWDLQTGRPAFAFPLVERLAGASVLAWSGDGRRLLTAWPGEKRGEQSLPDVLTLWDVATEATAWKTMAAEKVTAAHVDYKGGHIRGLLNEYVFREWDVADPSKERVALVSASQPNPNASTFLADGRLVVQRLDSSGGVFELYNAQGRLVTRRSFTPQSHFDLPARADAFRASGHTVLGPGGWRWDLWVDRGLPPLEGASTFRFINTLRTEHSPCVAGRTIDRSLITGHLWESLTGRLIADLPDEIPNWDRAALSHDGRRLAAAGESRVTIHDFLLDHADWQVPVANASALAFSPDGSLLATAAGDGTVLIWRVPRSAGATLPNAEDLWRDLGSEDAAPAWKAMWQMLDEPSQAIEILSPRGHSITHPRDTPGQIARLDHPRYAVREQASKVLGGRAESVQDDLAAALRVTRSEEQRRRLEQLLLRLEPTVPPTGETLRGLRCVWLLERIGSADAKKLLEKLADGADGSRVTIEAKAALERWPSTGEGRR